MAQHEHLDQAIAAVAMRQHGQVTRQQLLAVGLTSPARSRLERAAAALLACGPTAALSHASAMVLWELWKRWPLTVEVSVTTRRWPKRITVHHPINLATQDVRTHQGIRATTVARTLLDMAIRLEPKALTRTVNNALHSPYLTESQLADVLARNPTHPGTRLLRPHLVDAATGITRSELEDTFRHFGRTQDLPRFQTNVLVNGYVVDVYFEAEQLIVELDSWQFHKDRRAFEVDRARDADALTHGIPTVRITHERLKQDPDGEAARLQAILESRRQMLSPTRAPQPGGATATPVARPARRRARDRPAR